MTLFLSSDASTPPPFDLTGAKKRLSALRYSLEGAEFYLAKDALELALRLHDGVRKDKVTPEWFHQVSITLYLWTLLPTFGPYAEQILTAALLHDVLEDKDYPESAMRERFGDPVTDTVLSVSYKLHLDPGFKTDKAEHYRKMASDPCGLILKANDRINNQDTMQGVFTLEKIIAYVHETRTYILPALGVGRKLHPRLMKPLQNATLRLESQCAMLDTIIAAQTQQRHLQQQLQQMQNQSVGTPPV